MAVRSVEGVGKISDTDEDLRKLLETRKAEIKVMGIGGAGNNTVSRMMQVGVVGAQIIAANTDAQDLLYTDADKKVLLEGTSPAALAPGRTRTSGWNPRGRAGRT